MRKEGPNGKYVAIHTKVTRHAAERLNALAKARGMTIYEVLQMVVDTLIRYMDDRHNLTQEMEQAMSIFEHLDGWKDAFNIATPEIQKEVVEAVYILGDPSCKRRGFRAVKVEKPYFGEWMQTANVQAIFERLFNILMPELYMKLFRAKILFGYNSVTEALNALSDAEMIAHLNNEYRKEFEAVESLENGRGVKYGNKSASLHHRTPDSVATDQRFNFDDYDKELAEEEAQHGT